MRIEQFLRVNSNAIVVFCLLVSLGVISRFLMVEEPNFKPIGAIILFASFYFGRASIGVVAMLAVMLISDLALGFYEPLMMAAVYGSLAVCAALGYWISRSSDRKEVGLRTFASFGVASLAMSCIFFLMTNFAVWASGAWYPMTSTGLNECFVAAIPFFRGTVSSDLMFSQALLLSYGAVLMVIRSRSFVATR